MKRLLLIIPFLISALICKAATPTTNQVVLRSTYSLSSNQFDTHIFPITISNISGSIISGGTNSVVIAGTGTTVATNVVGAITTYTITATNSPGSTNGYSKIWRGLLNQAGTASPSSVVFENTLGGTLALGRTGVGRYTATLAGAFLTNKCFITIRNEDTYTGATYDINARRTNDNIILIQSNITGLNAADDVLVECPFQVLVYP